MAGITVVGLGPGPDSFIPPCAREAIEAADVLAGSRRHVEPLVHTGKKALYLEGGLDAFLDGVERCSRNGHVAVLLSGDPCLYSLLERISSRFSPGDYEVVPGIGSFQALFARLSSLPGWEGPVQWNAVAIHSLHGRPLEGAATLLHESRWTLFFLDSKNTGPAVARRLRDSGVGNRRAVLAEKLGYEEEHIACTTLHSLADEEFCEGLALLLVAPGPLPPLAKGVLPDSWFIRKDRVPMSKETCRALAVSLLLPLDGLSILEIGAGSGGITVELARRVSSGRVVSLERSPDALALASENLARAEVSARVSLIGGEAPEALSELRTPSGDRALFHRAVIGGHGARPEEVVGAAWELLLPGGRLLATANMPASADRIWQKLVALGGEPRLTHVCSSAARGLEAEEGRTEWMLSSTNPVFVIYADRDE